MIQGGDAHVYLQCVCKRIKTVKVDMHVWCLLVTSLLVICSVQPCTLTLCTYGDHWMWGWGCTSEGKGRGGCVLIAKWDMDQIVECHFCLMEICQIDSYV